MLRVSKEAGHRQDPQSRRAKGLKAQTVDGKMIKKRFPYWNTAKGHAAAHLLYRSSASYFILQPLVFSLFDWASTRHTRPVHTRIITKQNAGSSRLQVQYPPCHSPALSISPSLLRSYPAATLEGYGSPAWRTRQITLTQTRRQPRTHLRRTRSSRPPA